MGVILKNQGRTSGVVAVIDGSHIITGTLIGAGGDVVNKTPVSPIPGDTAIIVDGERGDAEGKPISSGRPVRAAKISEGSAGVEKNVDVAGAIVHSPDDLARIIDAIRLAT